MKLIGVLLIVLRELSRWPSGGFGCYTKREKVLDVGPARSTPESESYATVDPTAAHRFSAAAAVIGGIVLVILTCAEARLAR